MLLDCVTRNLSSIILNQEHDKVRNAVTHTAYTSEKIGYRTKRVLEFFHRVGLDT